MSTNPGETYPTTTPTPTRSPADGRTAGRQRWFGLAVLALPALLASLELTVTNLALPSIGRDLRASSTQLLWIVDIYAFLLAGSLIAMGVWGDRIGRRRLLMLGAVSYSIASVIAAYSASAGMLIGARALMGLAGATLMPSTLALASNMFPEPKLRATAISVIVASVSGGTAIGPLVGGYLLERFWWGSAFLLSVPVMAVLLVVAPMLLPEHRSPTAQRLDLVSAGLSLCAVLPVVYGLKQIAADGIATVPVLVLVAGSVVATLFVRRQGRLAHPFIDLRLFASRPFATAAGTLAVGIFVLWGSNYAIAQHLQLVQGLSPLHAGLWTAPSAFGVILGSTLAPRVARHVRPANVIGVGLAISAAGYLLLTQVDGPDDLAVLVSGAAVVSAGLGPMMALATDMVVGSAPAERAGAAAAISSTAPQLGGALGIALLGSVITAVYRESITGEVPAEVPDPVATAIRDNLSAATSAIATSALPDQLASGLLAAGRDAFNTGFQVAAAASATMMAATTLVVLVALKRTG